MNDLFDEIIHDMQADRASELWKKYGKWVIYTAISIVIVTAAVVYNNHYKREEAMRQTALYLEATDLMAKGDAAQAMVTLKKISVSERSRYYGLVLLKEVQAQKMLGKEDEAQKILQELARHDDVYGDVGKAMLKETTDAKKPTPLHLTRLEWSAWNLVDKGQNDKAAAQFSALAGMNDVPQTMRDRALMMANYLKNKTGATTHE